MAKGTGLRAPRLGGPRAEPPYHDVNETGRRRRGARLQHGEGATVRIVALTPAGRRGPAVTARVKGTLRYVSLKPKQRPKLPRKTR